ncbi:MAG: aspartate/glutamate racemase family protein [Solirubrobacteraceae bacterium MAG38_C4-C5]|nr:aspartate/glutamate racemase family protein [Candidatus Siliceabacter maunaloa]
MSARHEPTLGILMLEGKMANVSGCMAGDDTFPYRTVRHVVAGARTPRTPDDAIAMLPLYEEAAKQLSEGVDVITANCGLIALLQQELAEAVDVPVVTSSLVSVPTVARLIGPQRRIGILTFFRDAVGERNYVASGWSSATIPVSVAGVDGSEAWLEFLETKEVGTELRRRLGADLRGAIDALLEQEPAIGALVSECTMLPAVLDDIREDVPVPIFDLPTTLDWALSGYRRAAGGHN